MNALRRGCHRCGGPLPQPKQGRARKWCGFACKSAARRAAQPESPILLDCSGCGLPLEPQPALRGSPVRYHRECQVVVRKWKRSEGTTKQLGRYRALRAAGVSAYMAKFGMLGRHAFEATLALPLDTDSPAPAPR